MSYEEADKFYAEAEKREQQLLAEQDRLAVLEGPLKEQGVALQEQNQDLSVATNKLND